MTKTVKTAPIKQAPSSNDTGRVKVGGGMIRFGAAKPGAPKTQDAGKVHVGGGMIRF